MKDTKKFLALVLVMSILMSLVPINTIARNEVFAAEKDGNTLFSDSIQTFQSPVAYQTSSSFDTMSGEDIVINSPSEISYDDRISYEIMTEGLIGFTEADTRSAVVRFTLNDPGDRPVSFNYIAVSGSAETNLHLTGTLSGTVSLSQAEPQKDVIIEISPFADYSEIIPNDPNTFWTGEHYFYLYCNNIQNALFEGNAESFTVPVPVNSEYSFVTAYENAINTKLIDFNQVAGGTDGVYSVPESQELQFTGEIAGDVRKMIDANVFTHINLPQGYFINESNENQNITYRIRSRNDSLHLEIESQQIISLAANSQTAFYFSEFTRNMHTSMVVLGPSWEGNGVFNKLDFIFDYNSLTTTPDAISTCFFDETDQYIQNQVSFTDEGSPQVTYVSAVYQACYGDFIPVVIHFSEPVLTDGITFKAGDQTLCPIEGDGTISQTVSFLYRIGDEAINAESYTINVTEIMGAVDISGKSQEASGNKSVSVNISFDPRMTFAYCAEPSVSLDQGTNRNMSATVSIPIKHDTKLSNWLVDESRLGADNISAVVKAKAITTGDSRDIPLTVQTDAIRITGLTGSFTVPENNTGEDVFYALEIYMDTGSGYELIDSLVTIYAVQPLILVENESDITLDYTYWPPGDNIFVNAGSSLSLGYFLNVDATWTEPEYFSWSSSDENIARIDNNGDILLMSTGEVYFTLTVTNPLSEDAIEFRSRTLSVLESQDAYLYVPNGIKNQDLLIGSDAKISFASNLPDRNDLYGGAGTETAYTFTLYELDEDGTKTGSPHLTEVLDAIAQDSLNSYTLPASLLTKATERNRYGYLLEISAEDMQTGITLTAAANIRIRQLPAKASLIRPESVFMVDDVSSFIADFDIENKTAETEYSITVTKNSESTPIKTAAAPLPVEPLTINISEVGRSRLLDVYTVNLKAKNLSDEAWSYDSYCVYVYNRYAMNILLDYFPAPSTLKIDYDYEDGDIIYDRRSLLNNMDMIKTVTIDNKSYAWSAIADRVTWQVEGENILLMYNKRPIGDDYNPILLPGTPLILKGESAGSSVVTASHTLTGMTDSMNVTYEPLNDKLFLFRVYPNVPCELVYTNGRGQEKQIDFAATGEVGVYENSGIKGDVVIYPTDGAENVYDFGVINHTEMMANQNSSSRFNLYPINTVKLPKINYNVSLELFDEISGLPYTGDIVIRGGVYLNDKYQNKTTINGEMGNVDQIVSADEEGRYSLAFRPADFTDRLLVSDEISYVIEVSFADNSHLPVYITVKNDAIQNGKSSPMGVCLNEGIKLLDTSSIQNNVIVLSQILTIEGDEKSISDRICLDDNPESATLDMTVIVPRFSSSYYKLVMLDSSDNPTASSPVGELISACPFSDTVTLHFVCDIKSMLSYTGFSDKPGKIYRYYPSIRSTDWSEQIKLSKHIEVQNLQNMPGMESSLTWGVYGSEGDLRKIYLSFWDMYGSSEDISFSEDKDAVKDALEMMEGYCINTSSLGLEVQSTDDPLVYKGIIRFAVGSYSKDNPSGVFVASGEKTSFNFMPGVSDMKAMAKGTYLKKAREEMYKSRSAYKRYGGGAYMECLVYYSIEESKWKISLIYGDFYLGGGGTYHRSYNGWVSFIPVTSTFEFNMTAELGLTILNSQIKNETAYIPRLRPVFSIYGFGGVGFDYNFVAFKAGPYGFVEHEQNYLWYTDNNGLKMDGQQLKISGEVGVEYAIWLAFIKLSGKYKLADYTKSWEYNDYNAIQGKIADNASERSKRGYLAAPDGSEYEYVLIPVEESASFEDRSYLGSYDRLWGSPKSELRMFSLLSSEELTDVWTNSYPNATSRLSDDGEMMVYLSDMDSEDLSDTAILFAVKDETGAFSTEGTEIAVSDYPDSTPSLSGTKEGASAAWVRSFTDIGGEAGSIATVEDLINGLAASEVMAGIYKDGEFTAARLTNNNNPDLSPSTAAYEDKAITAWRSVTLGDMDNPLDFTSDYIMYSIYNGSDWSEAKYLYDGSIDKVCALNTAMLPDGTSAIVYQIKEAGGDSEIICAVLDTSGNVIHTIRLTDNITEEVNPQITTAEFPDGVKRFLIGWNAQTESDEETLQMLAVNADGTIYPEFSLELYDNTGATGYSNFQFTKGAVAIDDLSVVWSEPDDSDKDGIYEYRVFGTKLLVSEDNIVSASGKQKLLALNEGITLDSLDSRVDPDTGKLHFVILKSELSGSSTLATAIAEYKNIITVSEPYYEYEDLLPGFDMPVMFTVKNDGIEPISHITIELGDQSYDYEDEELAPNEEKDYIVFYSVTDLVANGDYTITAQFGSSGDTFVYTGVLKLDIPDVGIYQLDSTKETQRERGFRVLLQNTAFSDLKKGTHAVSLEVWDRSDLVAGSPLKIITISEDDLDILNESLLSVNITLTEYDLQQLLDENGEIPEGGAWLLFRTVLTENEEVIEDADISNDIGFEGIYSLVEKNGTAISLASFADVVDGKTRVQVEAINNSMNTIANGNLVVTLQDERGNVLQTLQTYNPANSESILNIPGEETKTETIIFNRTGYTADVTFARVSEDSTLLSVINLTGVPMEFDSNVFEYNLQSYDLIKTNLTVVAENPASIVSVTKNGSPVSLTSPIPMTYGNNVFIITVTTGVSNKVYTVNVQNDRSNEGTSNKNTGSSSNNGYYSGKLYLDGISYGDLNISLRDGRAVASLGSSAQEIFSGDTEAVLEIPAIPGAKGYKLELPAHALAGSYTEATLTVSTEIGSFSIPAGMLEGMANLEDKTAGINLEIADKSNLPDDIRTAVGTRPLLSLNLTLDGEQVDWNNPNAPVTVSIPYTPTAEELENPESIVIWYIDGRGHAVSIPNGQYDSATGTVTFLTTHFSNFAVVYNPVSFNDVPANAWYKKPVDFIAARDITSGTGNDSFSPEAMLTRGEFLVLMMRAYSISPDENPIDNFTDAGNNYFTGYLASAKRLGISAGVGNNMFAPDRVITRQETFTMLYNALKIVDRLPLTNSGRTPADFTDSNSISEWAKEAMEVLVKAGIVNGNNGALVPNATTTRAQMAQILYKLLTE